MAGSAASGLAGGARADPVRALQHALYRVAKADPGRRFHALADKIIRRDVLWHAWVTVRRNNGAPGIDKTTRICDQPVLKLLRSVLRAGVMEDGQVRPSRRPATLVIGTAGRCSNGGTSSSSNEPRKPFREATGPT
jgi:RNA-directed DNA polymerase